MILRSLLGALMFLAIAQPAVAHEGETHVTATYSPVPISNPVGESSPMVTALAAGGIVLVGGAGIYIYRIIRKGL